MNGLADTSLLVARETGRPVVGERVPSHLAVSVITLGELRAGVLAAGGDGALVQQRLTTFMAASELDPLPIDVEVSRCCAQLRWTLQATGQRMPVNDAWIAATAIAHDLPVVTQDDDFDVDIPGLEVIRV